MNAKLNELIKLVAKFEKVADKWSKTGAGDSEPNAVFQVLLVKAFKGKKPEAPRTVRGWELYSEVQGNGLAAAALGRAADACVKFIESVTLADSYAVEPYLRDYCWRVDW
jgi:hypothetical protein